MFYTVVYSYFQVTKISQVNLK